MITTDPTQAAAALAAGSLVALPTETVYGLGALASNRGAVARVYSVKGRPADHPLIVHVAGADQLHQWCGEIPPYAHALAARFWPGPLTLVLPRSTSTGDWVTAGQDTVGIRVPDHRLTLQVLTELGTGVAAPSANRFGRVSPTSAAHVEQELGRFLDPERDLILDGGPARVGVESTIVACVSDHPVLLRPGAISGADITAAAGLRLGTAAADQIRAPGTLAAHYAPSARVVIVAEAGVAEPVTAAPRVGLIAAADVGTPVGVVRLLAPGSVAAYAAGLYGALREADALGLDLVRVIPPTGSSGLAIAIRDRLQRAEVGSRG